MNVTIQFDYKKKSKKIEFYRRNSNALLFDKRER